MNTLRRQMTEQTADQAIEAKLIAIARENLLELDPGFAAGDDLFEAGLDSMAIMQLLLLIEENFGVDIPASELTRENFSTAKSIARLICSRRAGS